MRFLIDNGLLGREAPVGDEQWLDELTVVSSCTAIAGRLGLEHGYMFKGIWYGPRSERLEDEFEDGAGPRARAGLGGAAPPLPAGFDAERFLRLAGGRDLEWLKAASYLILSSHARPNAEELAELVGGNSDVWPVKYCLDIVEKMTSPDIGIVLDYTSTRTTTRGSQKWRRRRTGPGSQRFPWPPRPRPGSVAFWQITVEAPPRAACSLRQICARRSSRPSRPPPPPRRRLAPGAPLPDRARRRSRPCAYGRLSWTSWHSMPMSGIGIVL